MITIPITEIYIKQRRYQAGIRKIIQILYNQES